MSLPEQTHFRKSLNSIFLTWTNYLT